MMVISVCAAGFTIFYYLGVKKNLNQIVACSFSNCSLILKMLPEALFGDPKAAILTLKTHKSPPEIL
jgi:hypothetical protein